MAKKEVCALCEKFRQVGLRMPNGRSICNTCYRRKLYTRPSELCSKCGEVGPVKVRNPEGRAVCDLCYGRARASPGRVCDTCSKVRKSGELLPDETWICDGCFNRRFVYKICNRCQKPRPAVQQNEDGTTVCGVCVKRENRMPQAVYPCVRCEQPRKVQRWIGDKPVCGKCYWKMYHRGEIEIIRPKKPKDDTSQEATAEKPPE